MAIGESVGELHSTLACKRGTVAAAHVYLDLAISCVQLARSPLRSRPERGKRVPVPLIVGESPIPHSPRNSTVTVPIFDSLLSDERRTRMSRAFTRLLARPRNFIVRAPSTGLRRATVVTELGRARLRQRPIRIRES